MSNDTLLQPVVPADAGRGGSMPPAVQPATPPATPPPDAAASPLTPARAPGAVPDEADDIDFANLIDHTLFHHVEEAAVRAPDPEGHGGSPAAGLPTPTPDLVAADDRTRLAGGGPPGGAVAPDPDATASTWTSAPPADADTDHDGHTQLQRPSTARDPARGVESASAPALAGARPAVQVITCPYGHANPPAAHGCRFCHAPIVDRTVTMMPRPSLGVLSFSSGEHVVLDGPLVIGRKPPHGHVVGGEPAATVAIDDYELSRFHLEVVVTEWFVHIVDQGSTNGTTVQSGSAPPVTLRPHERFQISPSAVVHLGDTTSFTYLIA